MRTAEVSRLIRFVALWACWGMFSSQAQAAGKKPQSSSPSDGKRVVQIEPVYNVRIEMPDQNFHDFGEDFQTSLSTRLIQSGRYVLGELRPQGSVGGLSQSLKGGGPRPSYEWPGTFVPAARVTVKVEALSFQTGGRGGRMFYGFNERFRTPFNNGFDSAANEFPLRENDVESDWFDGTFRRKGTELFGSQAGLDLGDGFELNILFAWMSLKYALYRSELRLRLDIDAPLGDRREFRVIQVVGKGFFFDVAGAYQGLSGAIRLARRDAMGQALKNAIDGAYDAIDRALRDLPLTARIDSVLPDGVLLLGTGYRAEVRAGVRYQLVDHPGVVIEVISSEDSGAVAKVVRGDSKLARTGALLKQFTGELASRQVASVSGTSGQLIGSSKAQLRGSRAEPAPDLTTPAAVEQIELPWKNLKRPKIDGVPFVSELKAFLRSLGELVFLPYRIARYFMYDQGYHQTPDRDADDGDLSKSSDELAEERADQRRVGRASDWSDRVREEIWARAIRLSNAPEMEGDSASGPVVAVIDTGVDYNHPAMHERLWFNPTPVRIDGAGIAGGKDYYGWDFISGDPHAFDDAYHGTEVASLVSGVAPKARVMPLKVFNPWGVTSSAAIYGAFEYAVTHGATVILCAWATHQPSEALRQGIELARAYGVLVVAAAGDRGESLGVTPSYPASYAAEFGNVLTVAALDQGGKLLGRVREPRAKARLGSNFGSEFVGIAAPGELIRVATPRNRYDRESSSGMAAAIVAGAAARAWASGSTEGRAMSPREVVELLESHAERVPALSGAVRDGLSLRVR